MKGLFTQKSHFRIAGLNKTIKQFMRNNAKHTVSSDCIQ